MNPVESFKILGLLSVIVTWSAIAFILLIVPHNVGRSISHHAALRSNLYRIFAVMMTIGVLMMLLFMTRWLGPTYALPAFFYVIASAAVLLELIATWVPLTTGLKYTIHQYCSYGAASLVPVVVLMLATSPTVTGPAKYIAVGATIFMTGLLGLFLFVKKSHQHYLWYQSSDVLAFHLALLAAAYLR